MMATDHGVDIRATVSPWDDNRCQIKASAQTPNDAVDAVLNGLVRLVRGDSRDRDDAREESEEASSVAVPIRAEGADLSALLRELARELLAEIDQSRSDVRSVQFNGFVRTDDGYAGWGFVFCSEGQYRPVSLTIASGEVDRRHGDTRAVLVVER